MGKSTAATPKRRGRPFSGGRDPLLAARFPQELIDATNAWAAKQDERPSRSEGIRRLVELHPVLTPAQEYLVGEERHPALDELIEVPMIMGHAGKQAIEHLEEAVTGAKVTNLNTAPKVIDCEDCSLGKAHEIISY